MNMGRGSNPESPLNVPLFAVIVCFALVASAHAGDRVIASVADGECTLQVEVSHNSPTLRLRPVHPDLAACAVTRSAALDVLELAFAQVRADAGAFTSLALGRLVDYPWMAQALAESAARDRAWDAARGRPRAGDVNRYVAGIMNPIAGSLREPLERHGYRITGVSVEKVLVGGAESVPGWQGPRPGGKLPFDAQVWLRLERVPTDQPSS